MEPLSSSDLLWYYWDLISSYVSFTSILIWTIFVGFLATAIVIVLEIIFRKKILVRRRYKILKYLAYIYFVFFPLYTAFCASQWGMFHSIEKQVVRNIPRILGGSNALFNEHLRAELIELVGEENLKISVNQGIEKGMDLTGEALEVMVKDSDSISLTDRNVIAITSQAVKTGVAKDLVKGKAADAVSENTYLDKDLAEELLNAEIASLLETGAVNFIVEKKINSIFSGLKLQAIFMFLGGIAIPLGEIIISNYLEKKRRREEVGDEN